MYDELQRHWNIEKWHGSPFLSLSLIFLFLFWLATPEPPTCFKLSYWVWGEVQADKRFVVHLSQKEQVW